ncbi:glycosyltransferase family 39 protein [Bradyrhizobium sp. RD5-C2]|uniref:glycosyltransferase family 39 protein n=1 Tax=Bradyrhizobium sp. RD5-C2 TaxID=244562 RepID=UPI001CC7B15E|nr:glycosyltransferase family 39 protein [Bradyrhizobium sp. RD5-C2]GIQ76008.1 membrane protein [Bradyrhizobium sp. RD5-C2]
MLSFGSFTVLSFISFSATAAASEKDPARWRRPLIKWLEGIETGWSIPILLILFVAVWTSYLVIAYLGAGLHPDVIETWTLGRHLAWGYPKHPPLMGWITRGWTTVFPLTDWSLQLMAMVNAAVALWAVDLIARRFVRGEKRVIVLLLLMLLPVYQFHAQRFNANTVLLAVWPMATYCFLRAFEAPRQLGWAIAAGAACAVAMLGKYYSIFLVASFVFASVLHPDRRRYLLSASPWISALAGILVLGPHLHWLATTGATPFDYALAHAGADHVAALWEVSYFIMGLIAALAIPAITWVFIAGPRLAQLPADFRAMNRGLRLLLLVAIGTILFPVIVSLAIGTDLPSLWAVQGLFLFVVLIVCATSYPIERFYAVNLTVMVAGIAVLAVVVGAPIHALYRSAYGYEEGRDFYHAAATELTARWRDAAGTPLAAVSGDDALAFAAAFYSPDHPRYARPFAYQYTWGLPRKTTLDRGWAALCFADQPDCLSWMGRTTLRATDVFRSEFDAQATLLGRPGRTRRVVMLIAPPSRETPPAQPEVEDFSSIRRARD